MPSKPEVISVLQTNSSPSLKDSVELLTVPLILESSDILKVTASSSDSIHVGISYLSIT